jgi:hypothetical protein
MDPMSSELPDGMRVALKALDARAAERAATVDVERVAARVVERLRHEGAEPRRLLWMRPAAVRFAAGLVLLVAAGATARLIVERPSQSAARSLPVTLPAMDSLSTGQLEAVLKAAGELRAANFEAVPASNRLLDNLSEQELQQVLVSLDQREG